MRPITPAQAILLLIDLKQHSSDVDPMELDQLKKWYLEGFKDNEYQDFCDQYLPELKANNYEITDNWDDINNDPSKRYFETHLAHASLMRGVENLSDETLDLYLASVNQSIEEALSYVREENSEEDQKVKRFKDAIQGEASENLPVIFREYADIVTRIDNGTLFPECQDEAQRSKIRKLVELSALGALNADINQAIPIDVYERDDFSQENRGKEAVEGAETTRNNARGLMKGHMPLSRDDIALSEQSADFLKPSDQSKFNATASGIVESFNQKVHPFSNGISGTILAQLRNMAELRSAIRDNRLDDIPALEGQTDAPFCDSAESLANYQRLFISTMLFASGGHSLHEFVAPLSIPDVQQEFQSVDGYKDSISSIFREGNEEAFEAALSETIKYNKELLTRASLVDELQTKQQSGLKKAEPRVYASESQMEVDREVAGKRISGREAMKEAMEKQDKRIKKQLFSPHRAGHKKNQIIQRELRSAIKYFDQENYVETKKTITNLKEELASMSPKEKSKSYRLIEDLEGRVNEKINEIEACHKSIEIRTR